MERTERMGVNISGATETTATERRHRPTDRPLGGARPSVARHMP